MDDQPQKGAAPVAATPNLPETTPVVAPDAVTNPFFSAAAFASGAAQPTFSFGPPAATPPTSTPTPFTFGSGGSNAWASSCAPPSVATMASSGRGKAHRNPVQTARPSPATSWGAGTTEFVFGTPAPPPLSQQAHPAKATVKPSAPRRGHLRPDPSDFTSDETPPQTPAQVPAPVVQQPRREERVIASIRRGERTRVVLAPARSVAPPTESSASRRRRLKNDSSEDDEEEEFPVNVKGPLPRKKVVIARIAVPTPQPPAPKAAEVPAYTGPSYLSAHPLPLVALACRFLTLWDLLAVHHTSRHLSAAAAHPLTFQHKIRFAVDPLAGVQVSGPAEVFSEEKNLKHAIKSRLFRHMRLLTIKEAPSRPAGRAAPASPGSRTLSDFVDLLRQEHAPVLHSLNIQLQQSAWYTFQNKSLFVIPSLRFLKVLQVHVTPKAFADIVRVGLAKLELLQVTFLPQAPPAALLIRNGPSAFPISRRLLPDNLASQLNACGGVRHLVFIHPSFTNAVKFLQERVAHRDEAASGPTPASLSELTSLGDLRELERVSALETVERIHWLVLVSPAQLVADLTEEAVATAVAAQDKLAPLEPPRVDKIECVCIYDISLTGNDSDSAVLNLLASAFPRISRLIISHLRISRGVHREWPLQHLTDLSIGRVYTSKDLVSSARMQSVIDLLASARLTLLWRLSIHGTSDHVKTCDCEPLFRSLSSLTELSLRRITITQPHRVFPLLARLRVLRDLGWPYPNTLLMPPSSSVVAAPGGFAPPCAIEEEAPPPSINLDLASTFPSLTYLHVASAADWLPTRWLASLRSIPTLRTVKWKTYAARPIGTLDAYFADVQAKRDRDAAAHELELQKKKLESQKSVHVHRTPSPPPSSIFDFFHGAYISPTHPGLIVTIRPWRNGRPGSSIYVHPEGEPLRYLEFPLLARVISDRTATIFLEYDNARGKQEYQGELSLYEQVTRMVDGSPVRQQQNVIRGSRKLPNRSNGSPTSEPFELRRVADDTLLEHDRTTIFFLDENEEVVDVPEMMPPAKIKAAEPGDATSALSSSPSASAAGPSSSLSNPEDGAQAAPPVAVAAEDPDAIDPDLIAALLGLHHG